MPQIIYVEHDGTRHEVDVDNGISVMQGAINHGIDGIVGECGGSCACATCHCYVEETWFEKTGDLSAGEKGMLDCVFDPRDNSRLACQIKIDASLDGLVVVLPETQY